MYTFKLKKPVENRKEACLFSYERSIQHINPSSSNLDEDGNLKYAKITNGYDFADDYDNKQLNEFYCGFAYAMNIIKDSIENFNNFAGLLLYRKTRDNDLTKFILVDTFEAFTKDTSGVNGSEHLIKKLSEGELNRKAALKAKNFQYYALRYFAGTDYHDPYHICTPFQIRINEYGYLIFDKFDGLPLDEYNSDERQFYVAALTKNDLKIIDKEFRRMYFNKVDIDVSELYENISYETMMNLVLLKLSEKLNVSNRFIKLTDCEKQLYSEEAYNKAVEYTDKIEKLMGMEDSDECDLSDYLMYDLR